MKTDTRFVTLSLTSVIVPASKFGHYGETQQLVGIAMLIADRDSNDRWHFEIKSSAIPAGTSEETLLLWLTHAMPEAGTVIGWQLGDDIVDPMLDAASDCDPEVGSAFLNRLMKLVTGASIDLAINHGGANAPLLQQIAAQQGISITPLSPAQIESAWATGDVGALRDDVTAQVIAVWKLWLKESNGTAASVSDAFSDWLAG